MAGKTAAIKVNILGDAKGFAGALGKAEGKLKGFGKSAMRAGGLMTAGLTLPIVGAGVAAFKAAEDFDKAYDTIRVGTGATGATLEGLKDTFKNVVKDVPASFEDASMAVADLNTRLGLSGGDLEIVAKQVLELSRITGEDLSSAIEGTTRVMGDWGKQGTDVMHGMDDLFKVSQATGISITSLSEQLVKYGAPMRQMGFDFETAATLLGKFEKEGVNAELVMGSMRQALGKMAREGEPAVETFQRVTEEIKNAGSTSEANAIALELFGARAGPDMAAAIREGRFEVSDLVATLDASGESILGAAEDTKSFSEKLQELKNRVLVALEPLLMRIFEAAGDLMDKLAPKIENVVNWFTNLSPQVHRVVGIVLLLVAAAGPLLMIFGGLSIAIGFLLSPITLVVAAIAGLIALFVWLYNTNEGFREWAQEVAGLIRDKVAAAWNWFIEDVWPKIQEFWDWFTDEAWPAMTDALEDIGETVSDTATAIRDAWDDAYQSTGDFLGWLEANALPVVTTATMGMGRAWSWLRSTTSSVWTKIQTVVMRVLRVLQPAISGFIKAVSSVWSAGWDNIKTVAATAWGIIQTVVDYALSFMGRVIRFWTAIFKGDFQDAWETIKRMTRDAWNFILRITGQVWSGIWGITRSITRGIVSVITGAWSLISGITSSVWRGISGIISGALSFAGGIVRGAVNGIISTLSGLAGRARGALSGLASAFSAPFRAAGNAIKTAWNSTIGGRGITIPSIIPGLGGKSFTIPRLHTGGYVGLAPNEQLTVLEAGESVRSKQQEQNLQDIIRGLAAGNARQGDINITVNAGMGTDGGEIGRHIVEAIKHYEHRNGTNWRAA